MEIDKHCTDWKEYRGPMAMISEGKKFEDQAVYYCLDYFRAPPALGKW
jgi:hypothetical protein